MKRRVALWSLVGFAVACGWAAYALAVSPDSPWNHGALWTIAEITCPVAVLGKFVALKYYAVFAINAATYAALGLVVELVRRSVNGVAKLT